MRLNKKFLEVMPPKRQKMYIHHIAIKNMHNLTFILKKDVGL